MRVRCCDNSVTRVAHYVEETVPGKRIEHRFSPPYFRTEPEIDKFEKQSIFSRAELQHNYSFFKECYPNLTAD